MQNEKISTTNELSAFSTVRIELSDKLHKTLAPVLNEIHNTQYSERFWKLVLNGYVNSVISKRVALSGKVLNRIPEVEPINNFGLPGIKIRLRSHAERLARWWRSRTTEHAIEQILAKDQQVTLGFPELPEIKTELGNALPVYYPLLWKYGGRKRNRAKQIAKRFSDIYTQNIIRQLPRCILEHFDDLLNSIPLKNPEQKTFHVHNLHSVFNTMLIALYVERGAKLYWYQHGAYYGELIGHNAHHFEASVADKFRTWGWKIKPNDEPWKAYRLEKFKKLYDSVDDRINNSLLICSPRLNELNRDYFKYVLSALLSSNTHQKFSQVVIRPRPGFKDKSPKSQFDFIEPSNSIVIDDAKSSMVHLVKKAELVLQLTLPSTNFLECIYIDKPTIAIFHNDQATDIVKPYNEFFLNIGVFHTSVESIINFLNEVELSSWWKEVCTSEMYLEFKSEFIKSIS